MQQNHESTKFGMTDLDDAILDSIEKDPKKPLPLKRVSVKQDIWNDKKSLRTILDLKELI